MKIQDIAFIGVFILLVLSKKPLSLVVAGLVCIILAIPLFHFWVFFTAQKLIEYAFLFILTSLLLSWKKS